AMRKVQPPFELRQARRLTLSGRGKSRSGRDCGARSLESRQHELHGSRLARVEVVIEENARIPPADHARGAVPQRERDVSNGDRHLAEHWRPELTDAEGSAAIRQVHVGEARTEIGLLVAERWRADH